MNRIDQLTHNVEALCALLPEVTAATHYATPGSALAQTVEAAYEHLWSELIAQSAQVEQPGGWHMPCTIYRPTTKQRVVAERLLQAIEREMYTRKMGGDLRRTLRELAVQLRSIGSTLTQADRGALHGSWRVIELHGLNADSEFAN